MQEGGTALLSAAAGGHDKVVALLLKSGARINSVSDVSCLLQIEENRRDEMRRK